MSETDELYLLEAKYPNNREGEGRTRIFKIMTKNTYPSTIMELEWTWSCLKKSGQPYKYLREIPIKPTPNLALLQ